MKKQHPLKKEEDLINNLFYNNKKTLSVKQQLIYLMKQLKKKRHNFSNCNITNTFTTN